MSDDNKIIAELREDTGTGAMRRLRNEGIVPAVLNNSKKESVMLKLNTHDFALMLQHHASETVILDLVVGKDKAKKVLLKEVQHDPVTGDILHADFYEISMTEKMTVPVAVNLIGEPVGVTQEGGTLEHLLRQVEIECLPTDLVEGIDLDVSALSIGDTLQVSDIVVDSKLTIVTAEDIAVASVSAPRVAEATEGEEAAEGEEGAEGAEAAAGEASAATDASGDEEKKGEE